MFGITTPRHIHIDSGMRDSRLDTDEDVEALTIFDDEHSLNMWLLAHPDYKGPVFRMTRVNYTRTITLEG